MSTLPLATEIIRLGETHKIEELAALILRSSTKELTNALTAKLGRSDCPNFWNYLLQGFDIENYDDQEKRFACVKCLLDGLLKVELSYKQTYDMITRLCQDLPTFTGVQLVEMVEHSIDSMRAGDPKCVSWKDLLPETINVLATHPQLSVNAVTMSGAKYRNTTVHNLSTMRWPVEVLTPIADMFKDLNLSTSEMTIVLNKFAGALQSLAPAELLALAYQLFSMCSTAAQIIIPILALEKFFHRFYYKKLFNDMNSNTTDFDSIDAFSDKELREAEETILHHLNYCTQYKISEVQMCAALKNFNFMPDVILTPFVLSAILSMSSANREPDATRLSTAFLLPYMRNIIKCNEEERALADNSVWCRDSLQRKQVDLDQIFTVLIDQNKDGKDVITPGLVNLVFMCLKINDRSCAGMVHSLAIGFLTKFIRKRFVFGQGIVKRLSEWMIVEQEQYQYGECLTMLSVADTFTVSECVPTINYVMDFFLWIPGEQAMRMMSFILPVLKISAIVRDAFIEVLRKAMKSSDVRTRRMAVYGFCMILKQLNNSNALRSTGGLNASGMCTQHSISGFSIMSQATLGNRTNSQRHFDMLTLEIIGMLRNCFNQTLEIKRTLYENLQRAVELNSKLVPHVLQFIDWHFRAYFEAPSTAAADADDTANVFGIKFERIVHAQDAQENDIEVGDNLGRLVLFISHCLVIFERHESDYDTREMKRLLQLATEKIIAKELKFEEMTGNLTHLKNELATQQLNFIESLMAHALLTSQQNNETVKNILPLFKVHDKFNESLQSLSNSSKKAKKKAGKNPNESEGTASLPNITINGVVVKKIESSVENIWDLSVVEKFLRLLHEDIVPFAAPCNTTALRANCELVRYVFKVAASKIEAIRNEPEYKQLAHSRRTLKYLSDIAKVIYERCIKRLPELWRDFDMRSAVLAAECFQQCVLTANAVYKKKFETVFVKGFDFHNILNCKAAPAFIQDIIDEFMHDEAVTEQTLGGGADGDTHKIPQALLNTLEVLYENIAYDSRMTSESYTWLLKFCKENVVKTKEMGIVHKLLFAQRQKTHSGAFFNTIARHLGKVLGTIDDKLTHQDEEQTHTQKSLALKSITIGSSESCLNHLYATLRKQIEDVEYFINKANNLSYKYRIVAEEDRDMCLASLRSLERSICTQLVHISHTLLELSNVCIPLGACMDSLLRLLMQHYICLKNLARHFLGCCAIMSVSMQGTKFDLLLRVIGKPLPANIYALITYIESNISNDQNLQKKPNPQAEKAKVLRETRHIPKIILSVENFNKHVILLAKKTNDRLANFLHYGLVRDYRIKTTALKAAIEKTLSHSSRIEAVPSDGLDGDDSEQREQEETLLERMDADTDDAATTDYGGDEASTSSNSTRAAAPAPAKKSRKLTNVNLLDDETDLEQDWEELTTPEDAVIEEHETDAASTTQVFRNLATINKKAKKRTLRESEQNSPDVISAPPPLAKKRRGRSAKK